MFLRYCTTFVLLTMIFASDVSSSLDETPKDWDISEASECYRGPETPSTTQVEKAFSELFDQSNNNLASSEMSSSDSKTQPNNPSDEEDYSYSSSYDDKQSNNLKKTILPSSEIPQKPKISKIINSNSISSSSVKTKAIKKLLDYSSNVPAPTPQNKNIHANAQPNEHNSTSKRYYDSSDINNTENNHESESSYYSTYYSSSNSNAIPSPNNTQKKRTVTNKQNNKKLTDPGSSSHKQNSNAENTKQNNNKESESTYYSDYDYSSDKKQIDKTESINSQHDSSSTSNHTSNAGSSSSNNNSQSKTLTKLQSSAVPGPKSSGSDSSNMSRKRNHKKKQSNIKQKLKSTQYSSSSTQDTSTTQNNNKESELNHSSDYDHSFKHGTIPSSTTPLSQPLNNEHNSKLHKQDSNTEINSLNAVLIDHEDSSTNSESSSILNDSSSTKQNFFGIDASSTIPQNSKSKVKHNNKKSDSGYNHDSSTDAHLTAKKKRNTNNDKHLDSPDNTKFSSSTLQNNESSNAIINRDIKIQNDSMHSTIPTNPKSDLKTNKSNQKEQHVSNASLTALSDTNSELSTSSNITKQKIINKKYKLTSSSVPMPITNNTNNITNTHATTSGRQKPLQHTKTPKAQLQNSEVYFTDCSSIVPTKIRRLTTKTSQVGTIALINRPPLSTSESAAFGYCNNEEYENLLKQYKNLLKQLATEQERTKILKQQSANLNQEKVKLEQQLQISQTKSNEQKCNKFQKDLTRMQQKLEELRQTLQKKNETILSMRHTTVELHEKLKHATNEVSILHAENVKTQQDNKKLLEEKQKMKAEYDDKIDRLQTRLAVLTLHKH